MSDVFLASGFEANGEKKNKESASQQSVSKIVVINIKTKERNGDVIAVKSVAESDDLLMVASDGKLIQTPIRDIRTIGRSTSGVTLMKLDKEQGVKLTSVAILSEEKSK